MKKCPYCAEEIQDDAIVCRYCGRDLPAASRNAEMPAVDAQSSEKKGSSRGILFLLIAIVVAVFVLMNLGGGRDEPTRYVPVNNEPKTYSVTYEITGTAPGVSVTLHNSDGGTEQGDYKVPFRKTFEGFGHGEFVYLSAQNMGKTGTVTCKIYVNGTVFKESTSSGAYKIASCSGSIGE